MTRWTLGFLIGVVWIANCANLPSIKLAYLMIAIGIIFISLVLLQIISCSWILFFTAFCLGFSWALINAHHRLNQQLPKNLEGQTLLVQGRILTIPEFYQHALHFDYLVKEIKNGPLLNYPLHVRINAYYQNVTRLTGLSQNDIWQFAIRLRRPRSFLNPGGFDYQAELFQQNIQATGYIVDKFPVHLIQKTGAYHIIDNLRYHLSINIRNALKNSPLLGLINALTTGLRFEVTDKQWQVMRGTGTNHLFAISGLHLAFISGIIYFLIHFMWCRLPYAALWIPASQVAMIFSLVFAIFYSALAGFSIPTQRALLMLSVFCLSTLLRRHNTVFYSFNTALLLIIIIEPFTVLSPSFWLSFIAVAFILYAILGRIKPVKGWRLWCRVQFSLFLGLIPLSLLFFHQISLLSFIANGFAIPWIGFVILPLSLLGSLMTFINISLGNSILILAERLLAVIWQLLSYLSEITWTKYYCFLSSPWLFATSVIGFLLLLAAKGLPARWLGLLWILPLFFYKGQEPKNGDIWLYLLDVGQGLASVVRTQHHVIIYDTGPRLSSSFDMGKLVLLPFLQKIGVQQVDLLIVSHGDNDHSGGAKIILKQMKVNNVMSSIPKLFLPRKASLCKEKTSWQWDGVLFTILYPPPNQRYLGNNSSCVLKISNSRQSILLTGDIERTAENYLVTHTNKNNLASTILIVPHHGSKTSSTINFLNLVQPDYALFPTGYHNRFKFPHKLVLMRYQRLHSRTYNTAIDGAITMKLDLLANKILVETFRENYRHFWQI